MKRVMFTLALSAACMLLLSAAAFGGGFQLNEHGARAMAQAGAFAARAYDGSAIYFNPAGLGFQKGFRLYAGTTLIAPVSSFYGPSSLGLSDETKMVSQVFTPVNFYASYSIGDRLTVALGVNNPFGLGTEWPKDWVGKRISEKIDLATWYFTPTVSYLVTDELSVAVGASIVTGAVKLSKVTGTTLPDGSIAPFPFSPEPRVTIDMTPDLAYGFNAGVLYKISKDLSFGASYRSAVKLEAKGTAKFDPAYAALNKLPAGDVSAEITVPATGFVGLAYKVMENLEVEADYQYIGWSSYDKLIFKFAKDNSQVESPKNYEDTYMIRIGAEYTMGDLQLRGGYLYDHTPELDRYVDPMLPDASRNGLNIGFGYKLTENLNVDVAYLFLKFNQRTVTNTEVHLDGTYNNVAHLIGINFGYNF